MKFKNIRKDVTSDYTRDGDTVPVTKRVKVSMPVLPRDGQAIALRAVLSILVILTGITIAWSTYSIGNVLGGGIGYAAALVFDVAWIASILFEYMSRYDESKRSLPQWMGWALLAITMVAIFLDGILRHGTTPAGFAMGGVGALISLFTKVLWYMQMRHINAELTPEDRAWLTHQTSKAQSEAAYAVVERQTMRMIQNARLQRLAMQREEDEVRAAFGLPATTVELPAQRTELPALEAPALTDMSKSDAVRFVRRQLPDVDHFGIAEIMQGHGVEVKPEYVKQIMSRTPRPEPEPETEPETEEAEVIELRK